MKKTTLKKHVSQFMTEDDNICQSFTIIGGQCDEDYYFDYLYDTMTTHLKKTDAEFDKLLNEGVDLFEMIASHFGVKNLNVIFTNNCLTLPPDIVIVGRHLEDLNQQNSIKRNYVDIRNDLEKIKLIDPEDNPEIIYSFTDIIVFENKKEEVANV